MTEQFWKAAERRICESFGGRRRGVTGRGESDCIHDWLAIEIKTRKVIPDYIKLWIMQAEENAEPGQLAIVVMHERGEVYCDDLILMRVSDFRDWFGDSKTGRRATDGTG